MLHNLSKVEEKGFKFNLLFLNFIFIFQYPATENIVKYILLTCENFYFHCLTNNQFFSLHFLSSVLHRNFTWLYNWLLKLSTPTIELTVNELPVSYQFPTMVFHFLVNNHFTILVIQPLITVVI